MIDVEQLALQRSRYPELSDADFRFMLQQVDGRQRTAHKLPTFAALQDWWYPVRLSCEQCSSEATARYKAAIVKAHPTLNMRAPQEIRVADLTGGYGVDTYFMAQTFGHVDYIEQNEELCRIAEHNFRLYAPNIHIHNTTAEAYLQDMPPVDVLCVDPARRDRNGGKVFRMEDCEPNLTELLPTLRTKTKVLLFKLSPMLDITAALRALPDMVWDTHVVAADNEVKEVLLVSAESEESRLIAIDIPAQWQAGDPYKALSVSRQDEQNAVAALAQGIGKYLYEPNAAILKAGLYNYVSAHFGLAKLAPNTHLYTSDLLLPMFPGRVWEVCEPDTPLCQCNIVTRNYPLTPDQLKRKLKVRDGGERYIIGTRLGKKPVTLMAKRVQ